MHTTNLEQLSSEYKHIYLSPHLDDAVLSCGGAIAAQAQAGQRPLVVTLCTAIPTRAQYGPLAIEFSVDWNLALEDSVTARLAEDRVAMQIVGCDSFWVGLHDSIYRMPFGYDTRAKLFGTPDPDDTLYADLRVLLPALRQRCPDARFYAPMAIGYHVDHQITYSVARETLGERLAFYEDVYYVLIAGERERRMTELACAFVPELIDIGASLATKIRAIDAYASQVPELFGGSESMARQISAYAASMVPTGHAERVWLVED